LHLKTAGEFAFEEVRRRLDGQKDVLDGIRTRAGTLLAAGTVGGSFFFAGTLQDGFSFGVLGVLAVSFYLAALLACAVMFMNVPQIRFTRSVDHVIETVSTAAAPEDDESAISRVYETLARDLEARFNENATFMARRFWAMNVVTWAVGFEIVAWVARVAFPDERRWVAAALLIVAFALIVFRVPGKPTLRDGLGWISHPGA
jgi:hypothetical protein